MTGPILPKPRPISDADLNRWFTHHPPTADQIYRYQDIRSSALELARTICDHTPAGPDQTAAVRKIREAVMTANAAIACHNMATATMRDPDGAA